jgi:four helix bundle protein
MAMKNETENLIVVKSKSFAVRIVRLFQFLTNKKNEYILSKQLLRYGTSIGANIKEAIRGQSKADFISKISISLKEASETEYWLEILLDTNYITKAQFNSIVKDNIEIIKILTAISKTSKQEQL